MSVVNDGARDDASLRTRTVTHRLLECYKRNGHRFTDEHRIPHVRDSARPRGGARTRTALQRMQLYFPDAPLNEHDGRIHYRPVMDIRKRADGSLPDRFDFVLTYVIRRSETMFCFDHDILSAGRVRRYGVSQNGEPLRYAEAIQLWQTSEAFRSRFISILAAHPFAAYRWETPLVTAQTIDQPFAFVIVDSPSLDRRPDPRPFAEHFAPPDSHEGIVVFENLGRDATLVVPSPRGPDAAYGHLAAFTRQAPASQQHAFWRVVGETMQQQVDDRPVWLSTAGGGVAWLHMRLDDRPKYYRYQPYATRA